MMRLAGRSRRLVIVWGVLTVLVGAIVYAERTDLMSLWQKTDDGHGHDDPRNLVPVPIGELAAVEIVDQGSVHRFERDAQKLWFYHGAHAAQQASHVHQTDPEAAQRIEKALAAFGRARIERRFTLNFAALGSSQAQRGREGEDDVRDYGVTLPSMLILLYQPGQVEPVARYAVGDVAPDTYSRYIQRLGSPEVVTIANYQITNLQQLIGSFASTGAQPAAAQAPGAPVKSN
jgi:hypothetical protein